VAHAVRHRRVFLTAPPVIIQILLALIVVFRGDVRLSLSTRPELAYADGSSAGIALNAFLFETEGLWMSLKVSGGLSDLLPALSASRHGPRAM